MTTSHRIRVNFTTREFEIEGPADFVEQHARRFEDALTPHLLTPPSGAGAESELTEAPLGESFGQLLQTLSSTAGTDRLLAAGWFVQRQSEDRLFTTGQANALLKDQAIKLGNPSQAAALLFRSKYIFREKGKWRVSQDGEERLRALRIAG